MTLDSILPQSQDVTNKSLQMLSLDNHVRGQARHCMLILNKEKRGQTYLYITYLTIFPCMLVFISRGIQVRCLFVK